MGLYLEDLLLLAGSGCFTAAAALAAGCAAALATAGACLTVYALVVARSAGRGEGMLLRNAMRRPRAVEYGSLSWEDLNRQFRKIFSSGGPYDTGIRGAER